MSIANSLKSKTKDVEVDGVVFVINKLSFKALSDLHDLTATISKELELASLAAQRHAKAQMVELGMTEEDQEMTEERLAFAVELTARRDKLAKDADVRAWELFYAYLTAALVGIRDEEGVVHPFNPDVDTIEVLQEAISLDSIGTIRKAIEDYAKGVK